MKRGLILTLFILIGLTLAKNFLPFSSDTTSPFVVVTPRKVSLVSLLMTGDVMLGRSVMKKAKELEDPSYPFRKVEQTLKNADIVFINLENPIIKNCPLHESGFKFCADPEMFEGLIFAGVDVVNLANNHSGNFGQKGIDETLEILEGRGILATGLGELVTLERGDTLFGFLGLDLTTRALGENDLALIQDSNRKVDVLIVGVHWGVEYTDKPTELQRGWAKRMVQEGADVISGHHPHWVQDSESIDGKPVYYSLGNFVFDQMWSEETKRGVVAELLFENDRLIDQKSHRTYIKNLGQVEFVE